MKGLLEDPAAPVGDAEWCQGGAPMGQTVPSGTPRKCETAQRKGQGGLFTGRPSSSAGARTWQEMRGHSLYFHFVKTVFVVVKNTRILEKSFLSDNLFRGSISSPSCPCPYIPAWCPLTVYLSGGGGGGCLFLFTTILGFHSTLLSSPFQAHSQPLPGIFYRPEGKWIHTPSPKQGGPNVTRVLVGITSSGTAGGCAISLLITQLWRGVGDERKKRPVLKEDTAFVRGKRC